MALVVVLTLGLATSTRFGNGHPRVESFLMSSLRDTTQVRYKEALARLNSELEDQDVDWATLNNDERDYFLAEWLVDGYERGSSRGDYGTVLSALGRVNPRLQLKISWKVFDTWSQLQPVHQAPAAPPEFITAMIVASFGISRPELGLVITLAYSGLLRISEALGLAWLGLTLFLQPLQLFFV
jgi:hypothetical protein